MMDEKRIKLPGPQVTLPDDLCARLNTYCEQVQKTLPEVVEMALQEFLAKNLFSHSVYLSAPIEALMKGLYDENTTMTELKSRGDFGLGTFNGLDGEMVMLDGIVYRLKDDGLAEKVIGEVETPFACVTFFSPTTTEEIDQHLDYVGFKNLLDRIIPSENMFFALRIDGEFEEISGWTVSKSESHKPIDQVKTSPFSFHNIRGTLAGFYTPRFIKSLLNPGYHLHFLSADRKCGGHLHRCSLHRMRIEMEFIASLTLNLPVTLDYLTAKLI